MDRRPPPAPADRPAAVHPPVVQQVLAQDKQPTLTLLGHPLHVLLVHFPIALVIVVLGCDVLLWYSGDPFWRRAGLWAAGASFWSGLAAALAGSVELLGAAGIRGRVASWSHAVSAMVLLAVSAANWRLRVLLPEDVLPHGLFLSLLAALFAGLAGFHGGKLVFEHGIGTSLEPEPAGGRSSDPEDHPRHLG